MRRIVLLSCLLALAAGLLVPTGAGAQAPACPDPATLVVPGAEFSQSRCLDDLTTMSNPFTDTGSTTGAGTRQSGSLHSNRTVHPTTPVPGVQIEGWFPDSCDHHQPENNRFMPACPGGFRHNSQFVIRIPAGWDGRTLVVAGTPGIRTQFASDIVISDRVLSRGWAYASQDKGNTGFNFFRAGDTETGGSRTQWIPARAMEQWATLMETTTVATKALLQQAYGRAPQRTYVTGISNGGYQTRLALERYPHLFDGGVDWEGTLMLPDGPNLFTYLPPILRNYHAARAGSAEARRAMVHEGRLPPGSEPIWDNHFAVYWGLTQRIYRQEFDPEYTAYAPVFAPALTPNDPDAQYDYASRPAVVRERVGRVANTGDIHGKPLITLHPSLDALLPISTAGDVWARMVRERGHGAQFRYYVVEAGNHVDTQADSHPERIRPVLPCYLEALDALDAWVTAGTAPPPSGLIRFPQDATPEQRANECGLPTPFERVAGAERIATSVAASRQTHGIATTVVVAAAGRHPDALAAAPLAVKLGAPVLLVGDDVTDEILAEVARIGAYQAVIVGGTAAVPATVDEELVAAGLAVRRIAGPDRYGTAARIAAEVGAPGGRAVVASGRSFADALSAAGLAASEGLPILLVEPTFVPPATAEAVRALDVSSTIVAGGTAAVSAAAAAGLPRPQRVAGSDRYGTSVAVAELAERLGHPVERVYLATGRDFPDALSAGPVIGLGPRGGAPGGPLLLIDGRDPAGAPAVLSYLRARRSRIEQALVFGGEAAVGAATEAAVRAALR